MFASRLVSIALAAVLAAAPASAFQDPPPQDDATDVDSVIVATGESPLPIVGAGAANYSPEQTASFICENQDLGVFRMLTGPIVQRAHDATLAARQARIDHFRGLISDEALNEAELERQNAVRNVGGEGKVGPNAVFERDGLRISDVTHRRVLENGRPVFFVTGRIENLTDETRELPPVSMRTHDVRDFILASQTSQLDRVEVGPGEAFDFTLRFKNPPQYAVGVRASFAPPFLTRNFRGCEFFDPLEFDPTESTVRRNLARRGDAPPAPAPQVGEGAPDYSAAELAAMATRARSEAASAFNLSANAACGDAPGRRNWRDRMILADRLEEAWIATNAALEVRRDAAAGLFYDDEVEAAELDRQAAVRAALAVNPRAVFQPAGEAPGFVLESARLEDRGGEVQLRLQVRNTGSGRARPPLIHVVIYDRYDTPIAESVLRYQNDIRGGRTGAATYDYPFPSGLARTVSAEFAC